MKKLYFLITLFTTGLFYGQTNYLVENFDYSAGTLLSTNGWFVHSATTNSVAVNNAGLTWSGYIGSGIGNAALVNNTGIDVNKPLLANNISDGNVYASFLLKVETESTPSNDYFFHFIKYTNETTPDYTDENSAGFRPKVYVIPGSTSSKFKLGLTFNSNTPPTTGSADLDRNSTYLVVVKYNFIDGDLNDTASLYIFTVGDLISTEPTVPNVGPISATPSSPPDPTLAPDAGKIQGVALRQFSATQRIIVDGIYVRKEWNLTSPGTNLSIDQFAQNNTLKVYPNPVQNNRVSIFSSIEGEKEISLFDLNGRVVLKKTMTNNELDLTNVNKGVYMLQTKVGSNASTTKLIVN